MRPRQWTSAAGFLALAIVVHIVSCGGKGGDPGFPVGGADGGSGIGDARAASSSSGADVGAFGDDGGGLHPGCNLKCSADLHSVVDCNGNVVTQCPADQGCSGSTCVPACASADANKSTFGCEFYAVDPDVISVLPGLSGPPQGACFALFIANTWTSAVNITADWAGKPVNVATAAVIPNGSGTSLTYTPLGGTSLQPGQVAILFLSQAPNLTSPQPELKFTCPTGVTPAFAQDGSVRGTSLGKSFHVKTDRPVVAYDMFPFGGGQSAATSATLLVPTSAWDTNYIAVNAYGKDVLVAQAQPFVEIVASEPNTTVTISPVAAIVGGTGVPAAPKGQPTKYTLANAGDYVQFEQDAELTGSPILADKPVGVWGGATCLNIDVNTCCCDSAHQQLFPVKTLGNEYVAARYRDRITGTAESTPWRIVGAVAGTTLTYEPAAPNGAPTSLGVGQVGQFSTIAPFIVRSQDDQHPFYMSAHMTGANTVDPSQVYGRGDPEFVNLIPPGEWLSSYVFFTDPTYPETNLVVTRAKGPGGFVDVGLDCLGSLTGWLPIGSSGQYQYTRVDLSTGNFQAVGQCNNGRHEIRSNAPFGLTVWGWGSEATAGSFYTQYVSYAYPAGASVQPINTVIVPPSVQ
jgi:hypothetical protein